MIFATTAIGNRVTLVLGAAAALMLSTLSVQTVHAAPQDTPAIAVKYDAATINSSSGARALYQRLESAARRVCPDDANKQLEQAARVQQCRKDAVARAVRQIDNPRLAELLGSLANRG